MSLQNKAILIAFVILALNQLLAFIPTILVPYRNVIYGIEILALILITFFIMRSQAVDENKSKKKNAIIVLIAIVSFSIIGSIWLNNFVDDLNKQKEEIIRNNKGK